MSAHPRLGELLMAAGAISQEQLDTALAHQRHTGGKLGSNLVELGFIDEGKLAKVLSEQLHIPCATAAQIDRVKPEILRLIPVGIAERLRVLPLREDSGKLWIAVGDPTARKILDEIQGVVGMELRTMVCPELLIQYGLEKHYKVKRQLKSVELDEEHSGLMLLPRTSQDMNTFAPQQQNAPVYDPFESNARASTAPALGSLDDAPRPPAMNRPPRITLDQFSEMVSRAEKDDQVLDAVIQFCAADVRRAGIFLLRQGKLEGWKGFGIEPSALKAARVTVEDLPLILRTLQAGSTITGGLDAPHLGVLAGFFQISRPTLGMLIPIRVAQRPAGIVIAVDASLDDPRKEDYNHLPLKIDWALHILQLRRLLLKRGAPK